MFRTEKLPEKPNNVSEEHKIKDIPKFSCVCKETFYNILLFFATQSHINMIVSVF